MIRIAHEAPLGLFETVGRLTDYDYALVHLLEEDEDYRKQFLEAKKRGREIFLDNSAFEKGEPAIDLMLKWIPILQPDYYFLPDYWDKDKNIEAIESFIRLAKEKNLPGKKIGVVKGNNLTDFIECYKYLSQSEDIDMLALTHAAPKEFGKYDRVEILEILEREGVLNYNKPHHLLGCVLPQEMYKCKYLPYVYSCDTSAPIQQPLLENSFHTDGTLDEKKSLVDKSSENYLRLLPEKNLIEEIIQTIIQFRKNMLIENEEVHSLLHQTWVDGFVKYKSKLIMPPYLQKKFDNISDEEHINKHKEDYLRTGNAEDLRHWMFRVVRQGEIRWLTLYDLQQKVSSEHQKKLENLKFQREQKMKIAEAQNDR